VNRSKYLSDVAHSLGACQLLELEIKLYIERAFEVVRKRTEGVVPFRFAGEDYEDSSLERLISVFRKLSNNAELIGRLDRFRKDRNFVAHRAVTDCLDRDGDFDESKVEEVQRMLARTYDEAHELSKLVLDESQQFLGHYYFDEEKT